MTRPILLSLIAAGVCAAAPFAQAERVVRYIDNEPDRIISERRSTFVEEPVVERRVVRRVEGPVIERRVVRRVEPAPARVITRTTRTTTVRETGPVAVDTDIAVDRKAERLDRMYENHSNDDLLPHHRIFHRLFDY